MTSNGADMPKRSMPMQMPSAPVIARQGKVTPSSKLARRTPGGSKAACFSGDQARKACTHGIETTRTRTLPADRKSTRLNSSHSQISYAVFCLKKKNVAGYSLYFPIHDHCLMP